MIYQIRYGGQRRVVIFLGEDERTEGLQHAFQLYPEQGHRSFYDHKTETSEEISLPESVAETLAKGLIQSLTPNILEPTECQETSETLIS